MISRRGALASAVGASTAGILAACAMDSSSSTNPEQTQGQDGQATGQAVEVCKVNDVMVGSGKQFVVDGVPLLITQPKQGEFRAFSAICTHAGFVMQTIQNNEIICDNHGARFDAENGSVIKTPATRALGKIMVQVQGESVLVTL